MHGVMVGFAKKDLSVGVKRSFDLVRQSLSRTEPRGSPQVAQDKAIVYDYKANNEYEPYTCRPQIKSPITCYLNPQRFLVTVLTHFGNRQPARLQ